LSVQPKPLAGPYLSVSVLGAASGVLWQARLDRARDVQRGAGGRLALADEFLQVGLLAERGDDVFFPGHRAVARVGRVEHRGLERVLGVVGLQARQHLGGRVRGHRLRQEGVLHLRLEQRLDLRGGVAADRVCVLHQQAGAIEHLVLGGLAQHVAGNEAGACQAHEEHEQEDEVELDEQFHGGRSELADQGARDAAACGCRMGVHSGCEERSAASARRKEGSAARRFQRLANTARSEGSASIQGWASA